MVSSASLVHCNPGTTAPPVQLRGDDAHLVLSLQHLPQGQRRFAPLGVLSCSDICAGLLYRLGPSLELHQRLFLEQYKVVTTSVMIINCLVLVTGRRGKVYASVSGCIPSTLLQYCVEVPGTCFLTTKMFEKAVQAALMDECNGAMVKGLC